MAKEASINLWSAMTGMSESKSNLSQQDKAKEVVAIASKAPSFGTELSLDVDDRGNWTVRVFHHEDTDNNVEFKLDKTGHVVVTRDRHTNGIRDKRSISF